MRIEELILDGTFIRFFSLLIRSHTNARAGSKSYPVRTTIAGWDSSFNAITGLNGSGKSNILDAICFVLGLTNMTNVRAFTSPSPPPSFRLSLHAFLPSQRTR
jgi:AAA15 family ATPase/GTPase